MLYTSAAAVARHPLQYLLYAFITSYLKKEKCTFKLTQVHCNFSGRCFKEERVFVETSQEDISATSAKAHYLLVLHTFPVFPGVCFGDVCVCVFVCVE